MDYLEIPLTNYVTGEIVAGSPPNAMLLWQKCRLQTDHGVYK
jgi:hypothetical protein